MPSRLSNNIMQWYKANARDLPWRKTEDPYKIWVSEIMLQQTTVNAVIPFFERWMSEYPTLRHVAQAPIRKILKSWQGLGYYQRAKNLHKAAKIICKQFKGCLPNEASRLKDLPGFGSYTTGAVLSIAFDQRHPIIDANVRRVFMRLLALPGLAVASQDKAIIGYLEKIMPNKGVKIFNQALMELGALVCRSSEPLCIACPVREYCLAYAKGLQEVIPERKKKFIQDVKVVIAIIKKNDKFFIQKRPSSGLFADLWEFPGGKIEPKENARQALAREIREELNVEVKYAKPLFELKQFYTQFRAHLNVWSCEVNPLPKEDSNHKWVKFPQLHHFPMPSGSARIIDLLRVKKE